MLLMVKAKLANTNRWYNSGGKELGSFLIIFGNSVGTAWSTDKA